MKLSRALLLIVLVPFAVSLLHCGRNKEKIILAEFKDRSITVAEFEDAYAKVHPDYLPKATGIEGYKEFLETMLNKEIMAYKADEFGYDKDQGVVTGMDAFKQMGLQVGYLKLKVADKVKVTDEQVRFHYENKGVMLSAKHILCDSPIEAEEAYQKLKDGIDFESVCKQYSKAPDADEGGRVLTLAYGAYGPTIRRELFSLPVGAFTKPVEIMYGFFIFKVLKRDEPRVREPFEKVRATLEQEVRVLNEMLLNNQVTDEIRERAGVTWVWENIQVVYNALPPDRSVSNPPARQDEVYPLLYFEEKDLDRPLVTYGAKIITIKDFSDFYDQASFFGRPRKEYRLGGIKIFLTERIMADLIEEEMKASKIEENEEIQALLRGKQEQLMINKLYSDQISGKTVVTETMVQEYYDAHKEDFKVPEKRRFGVVLTGDVEAANKAYQELKDGARFRNVAANYSIDETTKETLGETDLLSKGEQPELDGAGFSLEGVGDVSKPFQTSKGWMILKLIEKAPAMEYSLDDAREEIRGAVKDLKNNELLNETLAKWKEELGVKINEKNLKKISVKDRTAGGEAGGTAPPPRRQG